MRDDEHDGSLSQGLAAATSFRDFDFELSSSDFHHAENTQVQLLKRAAVQN
jgi:hypothetical protein